MRLVAQNSRESREESLLAPRPTLHASRSSGGGFTLIEMLLVLAIIATLAALLLAAVFRGTTFAQGAAAQSDIRQLEVALENFKAQFGAYPPSRFILCEKMSDYGTVTPTPPFQITTFNSSLHQDSYQFLMQMFPRLDWTTAQSDPSWTPPAPPPTITPGGIDWNGNTLYEAPVGGAGKPAGVLLEGDQCLTFFLGGIIQQTTNGFVATGFSKDSKNPALAGGGRYGPYFDFVSSRLVTLPKPNIANLSAADPAGVWPYGGTNGTANCAWPQRSWPQPNSLPPVLAQPSYQDISGTVYAYSSSYKTTNGYNRYFDPNQTGNNVNWYPYSDCLYLAVTQNWAAFTGSNVQPGMGIWPYVGDRFLSVTTNLGPGPFVYQKPNSFQVLSAGVDKIFGPGTYRGSVLSVTGTNPSTITANGPIPFASGMSVTFEVESSTNRETVPVIAVPPPTGGYLPTTFTANLTKTHAPNSSITGAVWTPATAQDVYKLNSKGGADDFSNFSDRTLGTTVATQ